MKKAHVTLTRLLRDMAAELHKLDREQNRDQQDATETAIDQHGRIVSRATLVVAKICVL